MIKTLTGKNVLDLICPARDNPHEKVETTKINDKYGHNHLIEPVMALHNCSKVEAATAKNINMRSMMR